MGKRISQLDLAGPLSQSDVFPVVQGNRTKRATLQMVQSLTDDACECTLFSRYDSVSTGALAQSYYLQTYVMPANTLPTDGSWTPIVAAGTFAANGNTKSVALNINQGAFSQDYSFPNVTYNDYYWDMTIRLQRKSETQGKLYMRLEAVDNSLFMTSPETKIIITDVNVDFSETIQFGIVATNASASADVTCETFIGQANLLDPNS